MASEISDIMHSKKKQLASAGSRVVAYIIDRLVFGTISAVVLMLLFLVATSMVASLALLVFVLPFFIAPWLAESYFEKSGGQTPGKKALEICVTGENYRPISWGQALTRNFTKELPFAPFIGFILVIMNKKKQRVGDVLAKTLVVKA